jgi:hypothetical protein
VGGATVNAELPKMPESGMYSMRFDLSQIFDPNILKNMKYKLINHSKKIEAEYEFEQQSSARVYSDAVDNVELSLVPGAYLTEIKDLPLNKRQSLWMKMKLQYVVVERSMNIYVIMQGRLNNA